MALKYVTCSTCTKEILVDIQRVYGSNTFEVVCIHCNARLIFTSEDTK